MSFDPATIAAIASVISSIASVGGGIIGAGGDQETKLQKTQRKTIDEILRSISGGGKFSDLFNLDEDAFQRSIVDPALRQFELQTSPQIQQKFISSGLQRGTGLDDTLTRAGVDLQSNLDKLFLDFQGQGKDRVMKALLATLGFGSGAQPGLTTGEKFGQAVSGYASSTGFRDDISNILNLFQKQPDQLQPGRVSTQSRPGFEPTP